MAAEVTYSLFPLPPRSTTPSTTPSTQTRKQVETIALAPDSTSTALAHGNADKTVGDSSSTSEETIEYKIRLSAIEESQEMSDSRVTTGALTESVNETGPSTGIGKGKGKSSRPSTPPKKTTEVRFADRDSICTEALYAMPTPPPPNRPLPTSPDGATAVRSCARASSPEQRNAQLGVSSWDAQPRSRSPARPTVSTTIPTSAHSKPRQVSASTLGSTKTPASSISASSFGTPITDASIFASPTSSVASTVNYPSVPTPTSPPVQKRSASGMSMTSQQQNIPPPPPFPPPRSQTPQSFTTSRTRSRSASRSTTPQPQSATRSRSTTPAPDYQSLFPTYDPSQPLSTQRQPRSTWEKHQNRSRAVYDLSHERGKPTQAQPLRSAMRNSTYSSTSSAVPQKVRYSSSTVPNEQMREREKRYAQNLRAAQTFPPPPSRNNTSGLSRTLSKSSALSSISEASKTSTVVSRSTIAPSHSASRWDGGESVLSMSPDRTTSGPRFNLAATSNSSSSGLRGEVPEAVVNGLTVALGAVAFVVGVGVEVGKGAVDGFKAKQAARRQSTRPDELRGRWAPMQEGEHGRVIGEVPEDDEEKSVITSLRVGDERRGEKQGMYA